ncbi:MAG: hypothetical protein QXK14_03030 [Acidilobaceae archaeon]
MNRLTALLLAVLLTLPLLSPLALAGHPDRCNACHYSLYYDRNAGTKAGDLVQDVGTMMWNHTVYTEEAWSACAVCHSGVANSVARSVHSSIGCGCHAVIHAGKFDAQQSFEAWAVFALIGLNSEGEEALKNALSSVGVTVDMIKSASVPTQLPAYKPYIPPETGFGEGLKYLTRVLVRLPGNTPTAAPKFENGALVGYLTLYELFTAYDNGDGGDFGTQAYGVEVQLLTFRYKPTYNFIGPTPTGGLAGGWSNVGPVTGGVIILPIGTRAAETQNMFTGPYAGYTRPAREAWLVCYNCHFVTATPVPATGTSPIKFADGFWLIGIPASVFELTDPHNIQPVKVVTVSEAPAISLASIAQALVALFAIAAGLGLAIASRRVQ